MRPQNSFYTFVLGLVRLLNDKASISITYGKFQIAAAGVIGIAAALAFAGIFLKFFHLG